MNSGEIIWAEGRIIFNREVVKNHLHLRVAVEGNFSLPRPGQFAMIRLADRLDPLLARPLSIYDCNSAEETLDFIYRVVGHGTRLLSRLVEGDKLDLLGPLGRPFHRDQKAERIILIAGGMGLAPLNYLLKEYTQTGREIVCYLGFKRGDEIIGLDSWQERCSLLKLTSEDGSVGIRGLITDLVQEDLPYLTSGGGLFYACGPRAMLKRLAEIFRPYHIFFQVSLEERMACGLGACLGCAVEMDGKVGEPSYRQVCCHGPVFHIGDIKW